MVPEPDILSTSTSTSTISHISWEMCHQKWFIKNAPSKYIRFYHF